MINSLAGSRAAVASILCIGALLLLSRDVSAGFACLSNPCAYGICMDDLNSTYSCYCIDGYTGVQCQTNWDECWSSPCQNGGTCVDGVAEYNCTCPEGFVGDDCEENFDECLSNPCLNNGTCEDVNNGYLCHCSLGFLGAHCEVDVAVCNATDAARCENGGSCIEGRGLSFYCQCSPGWEGKLCTSEIDECAPSPCQNGGVCIDKQAEYACACLIGFTGVNCEEEVLVCEDSPCTNGALCLMEDGLPACYCVPDYHGDRCQMQYDECHDGQLGPRCTNGGTCIDGIDGFTCSCPPDLTGDLCECLILDNYELDCNYTRIIIDTTTTEEITIPTTTELIETTTESSTITTETTTTEITESTATTIETETTVSTHSYTDTRISSTTEMQDTTIKSTEATTAQTTTELDTTTEITTIPTVTTTERCTDNLTTTIASTTNIFTNYTTEDVGITERTTDTTSWDLVLSNTTAKIPTESTQTTSTETSTVSETTTTFVTEEVTLTISPIDRKTTPTATPVPASTITQFFTETPDTTLTTEFITYVTEANVTSTTVDIGKETTITTEATTTNTFTTDYDNATITNFLPDCNITNCRNGATCVHTSDGDKCVCPFNWQGSLCESKIIIKTSAFSGDSYLTHRLANVTDIDVLLKAKTLSPNGLLLFGVIDEQAYMSVYLESGLLKFKFSCGIQTMLLSELEAPVNTGYEMAIEAKLDFNNERTHCNASLKINDTLAMSGDQISLPAKIPWSNSRGGKAWIHLGGAPQQFGSPTNDITETGFVGCMHSLQVSGKPKSIFKDAVDGFEVTECASLACLSNPCYNGATCEEHGEKWKCVCTSGFVGSACERSICENNPCQFGATCTPFPASGFICICPLGKHGQYCEHNLEIAQPSFSSSINGLSSFASYPIPGAVSNSMELRFKLVPYSLEQISLLAFIGQQGVHDSRSDHMSISFVKGYIMLTWNLGSGPRRIFTTRPITTKNNKPNIIRVGRTGRRAWLLVDNMGNITGRSPGHLTQLNVRSELFIGGHEALNFSTLPHDLPLHSGFSGCIFDVEMKAGRSLVSVQDSRLARGRGVGRCETSECHSQACQKGGACLQHGSSFTCLCQDGWFGPLCTERHNLCDSHHNKCDVTATCVPTISGFECDCPFSKTGNLCEKAENLTDIRFTGTRSFVSIKMPPDAPVFSSQYNFALEINPLSEKGLVFYNGNNLGFASLSLQGGVFEFRIKDKSGHVTTLRSGRVLAIGVWHNVKITRFGRRIHMMVEGVSNTATAHPEDNVGYFMNDNLFLGGIKDLSNLPYDSVTGFPVPFKGCIRKFELNSIKFPLNKTNIFESRNIADCDGSPCGGDLCDNGGTCWLDPALQPKCSCPDRYRGDRCESIVSCEEKPCENKGRCIKKKGDVSGHAGKCACPMGWAGPFCEITIKGRMPQFSGKSFMKISKIRNRPKDKRSKSIVHPKVDTELVHLNFSTIQHDAVIFWTSKNKQYLGIGLENGYIKLASSILGPQSDVPLGNRLSDGAWHDILLTISENNTMISIDGTQLFKQIREDSNDLIAEGSFYLGVSTSYSCYASGGFPGNVTTEEMTYGLYLNNFSGCLEKLSIGGDFTITDFSQFEGENIGSCE